jgi:hypothetical protein
MPSTIQPSNISIQSCRQGPSHGVLNTGVGWATALQISVRVPSLANENTPESSEAVRDRILIQLAGNAAQYVRNPSSPRHQDGKDWPRAEALAGSAGVLEAEWERAVALLEMPEHWQRVDRIARALLRERVLETAQIAELTDRAQ